MISYSTRDKGQYIGDQVLTTVPNDSAHLPVYIHYGLVTKP